VGSIAPDLMAFYVSYGSSPSLSYRRIVLRGAESTLLIFGMQIAAFAPPLVRYWPTSRVKTSAK
jgi:hypothetical protein